MAYSTTKAAILARTAGWETTLASDLEVDPPTLSLIQRDTLKTLAQLAASPLYNQGTTVLTGATTLTAADNGKTYLLNLVGGFTVTLPAAAAGLYFRFRVKTAPTTAYIIAAATADTITGIVIASTGGDEDYDAAGDTVEFVASTALKGDWAEFYSDGTDWHMTGFCNATGAITISG